MSEHSEEIGGLEVFWRAGEAAPILYLHGVPNSSGEWVPFLERTGGLAPDLPGFGRSGKPASFDYSIPGYEWHRWARVWRTPFAGEMAMGLSTKWAAKRDIPAQLIDEVWEHFDHGTQRAILKLYRSAPPEVLERSGRELGRIDCPTLVLWPDQDPYIGAEFGPAYAEAIGANADLRVIEGAGHWPWLDRPALIDDVAAFLSG